MSGLIERLAQMDAAAGLPKECLERATYLHAMVPEGLSTIEQQSMDTLYAAADHITRLESDVEALATVCRDLLKLINRNDVASWLACENPVEFANAADAVGEAQDILRRVCGEAPNA